MIKLLLLLLLLSTAASAQTTFTPVCAGADDTARFTSIISTIGANTGTIRLPYKNGTRCASNTLTIPSNITLDNSDGTGIKVNTGHVLTVVGPVVNPVGKPMFFGPGSTVFTGNTTIGTNGQALTSDGIGGTSWTTISGGGGGGLVDSVFGRTGTVVAVTNDYSWPQINKAGSSLADLSSRSADDLSNGTTGTGLVVLRDSPTLITPTLGNALATTINGLSIATTSGGSLSIASSKSLAVSNTLTLAGSSDGFTLTVPATGTAVLTSRTITEGAGLAGNTYDLSANRTLALGTPSTLSVSSLTSVSGTTHSHAITSSANPGAAASILATNASGHLQLTRLGIGIAPTQPLEVNGNIFISAATANLFLKDTSTGLQASTSTVITPLNGNALRSTDYTSGLVGWNISALGNAEFNNVDVRGAIHASIFTYNAIAATAGSLGVFKSAAKLRSDVTIPAGPTYGTTTVDIDVVDAEGLSHAASQLFVVNDILRLKDGLVGDTWLKVTAASDQTTFWRYTAAIMAGSNTVTYRAGLGVPDYGLSGDGFIIQTADQANSPYLQMATHEAGFSALSSAGTLTITPQLRAGNLNGSYGYASNVYGFAAGQYGVAGKSWLTVDPAGGVRIGNNTTTLTQVDAAGNASFTGAVTATSGSFTGSITASSGTIAGWTINAASINSGTTYVASGLNIPAGGVAWFGKAGSDVYSGWYLRDAAGRTVHSLVNHSAGIYPYLAITDTTRPRIVIGGLNFAFNADGSTDSMGMKIWNSAGTKLVEFSDVQNIIAGWTIDSTKISSTGIDLHSTSGIRITEGAAGGISSLKWTLAATPTVVLGEIYTRTVNAVSDTMDVALRTASGNTDALSTLAIQSLRSEGTGIQLWLRTYGSAHATLAGKSTMTFTLLKSDGNTGSVLISNGSEEPAASAVLELKSTTGAFLPPRMTTAQRDALTPSAGMLIFNTTTNKHQGHNGTTWNDFY